MKDSSDKAFRSSPHPLFRSYGAVAGALGLVLAYAHYQPGQVYPFPGLWVAGSAALLFLLALWLAMRGALDLGAASGLAWPLVLFTGWFWLRTAFSRVPSEGAFFVGTLILGVAFFWLGVFLAQGCRSFRSDGFSESGSRLAAIFFAALSVLFALHAVFEYHWVYPQTLSVWEEQGAGNPNDPVAEGVRYALGAGRVSSKFGNPNVFCGFLAMCFPLLAAAGWETRGIYSRLSRGLAGIGMILLFYAAFRTGSMGGFLTLIVGLAAVLFFRFRKHLSRSVFPVVLTGTLFFLFFTGSRTLNAPSDDKELPSSGLRQVRTLQQRVFYVRSGWEMFSESPFAGHGAGAYARLYPKARFLGAGETRYAHNFLVQIGVETGLVGLGFFFWLLAGMIRRLIAMARSGEMGPSWWSVAAAMLLFLFHSLGDYTFYVREIYLDFCLLLGVFGADSATSGRAASAGTRARRCFFPAVCVLFIAAGLWKVVAPAQIAAFHRQNVEDIWKDLDFAAHRGIALDRAALQRAALTHAGRAIAWNPSDPWLYQLRAHAYGQTGRFDAMRHDLEKAVSLHPDSASLRAALASFEWDQGNRERSLLLLDQAIPLYPLRSGLHEQRARYLDALGKPHEALEAAREAVRTAFTPQERLSSQKTFAEIDEKRTRKEEEP